MKRAEQVREQLMSIKFLEIKEDVDKAYDIELFRIKRYLEDVEDDYCEDGINWKGVDADEDANEYAVRTTLEVEFLKRGYKPLWSKEAMSNLIDEQVQEIYGQQNDYYDGDE